MSDASEAGGALTKQQLDEQKIARAVAIGLPAVTFVTAAAVAVVVGPATSILVVAAGGLLGVIAILWGSLRILSGDAPLPPELEELDMRSHADALTSRKKMLLRALKDLENEKAIGKLEAEDYEPIAAQYRAELKIVLAKIDEQLAPNRALAEAAAKDYLAKAGIGGGYRTLPGADGEEQPIEKVEKSAPVEVRIECPKCHAKNERDAKFCKECATKLSEPKNENADA